LWILDSSSAQTVYKGQPMIIDQSADTVNLRGFVDATVVDPSDVFIGIAAEGDRFGDVADAFAEGERWAVEFVFDRFEGKAVARTELTGADGAELPLNIGVTFVKPSQISE
jgi:hypothetical protein